MKTSKVLSFVLIVIILLISGQTLAQNKPDEIDRLLKDYTNKKLFNGTVLVAEKGNVVFKNGYGFANFEWNIKNIPEGKFRIGSITKQITAMLIMQLVQEGKLSLNDKLSDMLSYFRKDVGDKVTLHQLLTHTSGIPSYTTADFFRNNSRLNLTTKELITQFCSEDLEFEPGSKIAYNNSGYVILGGIIEEQTGMSYDKALRKYIFDPLELNNTGYDITEKIIPFRVSGYEKDGTDFVNADYLDMSLPHAAGALYSTVDDLYKWERSLYTEKLINKELRDKIFEPHFEYREGHYGYGWYISEEDVDDDGTDDKIISHGGGINGFNTLLYRVINKDQVVILLNNTGSAPLAEITSKILNILNGLDYELPKYPMVNYLAEYIEENGSEDLIEEFNRIKNTEPDKYDFSEQAVNTLGYHYLRDENYETAIALFQININEFPESFNVYDSMGEAFMEKGNKEKAIEYYKKSIEINPRNFNGIEMLKKLGIEIEEPEDAKVSPEILKKYEGEYQLQPNFIITITTEDDNIFAQATGQPQFQIFPSSEKRFYLKAVEAEIEFVTDENHNPSALILYQNGREMKAEKIK